jgi:hypothetical protein
VVTKKYHHYIYALLTANDRELQAILADTTGVLGPSGEIMSWDSLIKVIKKAMEDHRRSEGPGWMDFVDLHKLLYEREITIRPEHIKTAIQMMDEKGLVFLGPWTEPLYQLPYPEYAIMQKQVNVLYFVRLADS